MRSWSGRRKISNVRCESSFGLLSDSSPSSRRVLLVLTDHVPFRCQMSATPVSSLVLFSHSSEHKTRRLWTCFLFLQLTHFALLSTPLFFLLQHQSPHPSLLWTHLLSSLHRTSPSEPSAHRSSLFLQPPSFSSLFSLLRPTQTSPLSFFVWVDYSAPAAGKQSGNRSLIDWLRGRSNRSWRGVCWLSGRIELCFLFLHLRHQYLAYLGNFSLRRVSTFALRLFPPPCVFLSLLRFTILDDKESTSPCKEIEGRETASPRQREK